MRWLVSLISEQTIPNILLLKTITGIDRHLFITTARMTDSGRLAAIQAFCPQADMLVVTVDEYNPLAVQQKLSAVLSASNGQSYLVNLTGGTKIMALAAWEFFKHLPAQFLYLPPLSNSVNIIYPSFIQDFVKVEYFLSPMEYLRAYGVDFDYDNSRIMDRHHAETMFTLFTRSRIRNLQLHLNKLGCQELSTPKDESIFLSDLSQSLGVSQQLLKTPEWLSFLKGGWFEVYVYHRLIQILPGESVCLGLKVAKKEVSNELDLVFTHANVLYVLELKTKAAHQGLRDALYKLDSVRRDLGLFARCGLAVAYRELERSAALPALQARAKSMGIALLTYSDLNPDSVERSIRGLLNT